MLKIQIVSFLKSSVTFVDIDGEFKQHIQDFVPFILSKENLMPKKFLRRTVMGEDMILFMKVRIRC